NAQLPTPNAECPIQKHNSAFGVRCSAFPSKSAAASMLDNSGGPALEKLLMLPKICILLLAATIFKAATIPANAAPDGPADLRAVLKAQQEAWNRGDIDGFMNGYWRSHLTQFVSGDE